MKRVLMVVLAGFLGFALVFLFVYLVRAFRITQPIEGRVVQIWHGDNFLRAVLVAELIAIGLLVLVVLLLSDFRGRRQAFLSPGAREWLMEQSEQTSESPESIAERAITLYRARLEEGKR